MATVTVIDYGCGNLLSVARAFEHCGATVILTDEPRQAASAEYLVLPGVGAFADGMAGLRQRRLVDPMYEFIATGRPFLGICLGMQMMFDTSEEFGNHCGLGLVPGKIEAISPFGAGGLPHKIPHIGWNQIFPPSPTAWDQTILADGHPGSSFYFVHSFCAVPEQPEHCVAQCSYDGISLAAVVRKGNAYGCQFHPEKSGPGGLRLLSAFLAL